MTGSDADLANPPLISDLLKEHRDKTDQVLAAIKPDVREDDDVIVDDLFALRFLLSSKTRDVSEAVKHARETLKWRRANKEMLKRAAVGDLPNGQVFNSFVKTGYGGVLSGYHPVFIVRAGIAETPALMNTLTHDQVLEYLLAQNEKGFRMTDQLTRSTGRLCKLITVIDGAHMSIFKFDRRFPKAQGASSHLSAVYYPQLLGKSVMINPPSFFKMMFAVFSIFMSSAAKEKFGLCGASKSWEKDASVCPFLKLFGPTAPAAVPSFLGGTLPCPKALEAPPYKV